jgi:hypothetical protein
MQDRLPMTDDQFLAAFLDASIPPSEFDHRGHLRAAWLLLQRRPLPQAVADTCAAIHRLATHLGVPQKYNCTLTTALVRVMAQAGGTNPELSWEAFLAANEALVRDARAVLARHYSPELLESPAARQGFIPPDRQPLPA